MTPKTLALISIAVGVFPMAIAMFGMVLAKILGCHVDEGNKHECMFCGRDIGGFLYGAFMFFWLELIAMPIGIIGVISSAIWWYVT